MAKNSYDFSSDAEAIRRRRKIADMMTKKGQQSAPINKSAGRFLIANSPLEGLSQVFNAYQGRRMGEQADKMGRDLESRRQDELGEAMGAYGDTFKTDPRQAVMDAMVSGKQPVIDMANMDNADRIRKDKSDSRSNGSPYFSDVDTAEHGLMTFDHRAGVYSPPEFVDAEGMQLPDAMVVDNQLTSPRYHAPTQKDLSSSKAYGSKVGDAQGLAASKIPAAEIEMKETFGLIDELLVHPGMKMAVGASGLLGVQNIHGTDAYNFQTRYK